jgi:WD40 repeat protein
MRRFWQLAALCVAVFVAAPTAQARELADMSSAEIKALQQRLTDGGCYRGSIDGQASPALQAAINTCPSQDPVLRIEIGMHTATIQRIGIDRDCRLLATGSTDKTVRLWSMPEGRLLRTLRPPIGPGYFGMVFAVAVSPDGKLVAAGGYDANRMNQHRASVYLFDAASGALKARVGDFGEVSISQLAFSPDGRFVAAMLADHGLRVIDTERMSEVAADRDYGGDSYGAAFAPDGRLFTVAYDGYLRAYDTSFRLVRKIKTRGGRQPYTVAVDPSGDRLAVGYYDSHAVDVYKTTDVSFAFAADTARMDNVFTLAVAWSSDGRQLIAGGNFHKQGSDGVVRVFVALWNQSGRGPRHEQPVALDSILDIVPCGTGFAVGAGDPLFALLDQDGTPRLTKSGVSADMRGKLGEAFRVSRDGGMVRFGLEKGNASPVLFDLPRTTLSKNADGSGLAAPNITGISVSDWPDNYAPKLAGKPLKLKPGEASRSLAITPDGGRFVLGTNFSLLAFDKRGQEQWKKQAPGDAWGVNVTGDGRAVLAAYADGTIRWHRMSDGQELLALFVDKDDLRWVAWTPTGYYMASPGGEDLIGWHLNRGWDQAADFFPASRFRDRFNRPDIVRLMLDTLDEDAAIRRANEIAKHREDTRPLIDRLPPIVRLTDLADGTHVSDGTVKLNYTVRSPSGQAIERIDVLINGRPVKAIGLPIQRADPNIETKGSIEVALTQHFTEVGLIAWTNDLASEAAHIRVTWDGAPEATRKLYALVVGVSQYAEADMALAYAAKDANDFAKALQDQKETGFYTDVETRVITDRDVTRTSIIDGLAWLEKMATNPNDVSVLFLAGHGLTDDKGTYWFFPADANVDDVRAKGVSQEELRQSLQGLSGKVLWFLDTCHAGSAAKRPPPDINLLVNKVSAVENGGIVVFASSTGREASVESPSLGNGAFTKAVVEGIELGQADLFKDGFITTQNLGTFVAHRVNSLTGGQQNPVMQRPPEEPDFAIAEVRK